MKRHQEKEAVRALKDVILQRGLRPGDPMPTEAELVEELGISRSSLREAVRTLVALDIVEVRHGHGTFVGEMSLRPLVEGLAFRGVLMPGVGFSSLRDVVEVRLALDAALANQIVGAIGDKAQQLRADVDEMVSSAERGERFTEADRSFHQVLADGLDNALYPQLVAAFWDIHQLIAPQLGVMTPRDLVDSARSHQAMLDAALAGDVDAYRAALADHYEPILRMLRGSSER